MAKGIKTGGRDFQKGHKFSKGAVPIPVEVIEARKINKVESERILNKFLHLSLDELAAFANDKKNTVHEMLVARILYEGIKRGDHVKLEWVYSRLVGKVKEEVEVSHRESLDVMIDKWKTIDPKKHVELIRQKMKKEGNE